MWNDKKSSALSLILCFVFAGLLATGIAVLPPVLNRFAASNVVAPALTAYYLCVPPAGTALYLLIRLLLNIRRGEVFIESNTSYLRGISWCCATVSIAVLASVVFLCASEIYTLAVAFSAISVASIFLALILRILKNVFAAAVELKAENDMTI